MKRKIYDRMLMWKDKSKGKTALLIEGARRIGKSYIVKQFAENEYKSYIIVDFNDIDSELLGIFEQYLSDRDSFFLRLSVYYGVKLYERDTVIVFDEVQLYPKARAAIKYLVADGRYDYIETGSLVSLRQNVKDIVIPSEEEALEMFPMDFEEFLWAMGEEMLMDYIRRQFSTVSPMGVMHRKAFDYLRQYMVVGGMPQSVLAFSETKDLEEVDRIKRAILHLYRNDILKYAKFSETRVTRIFEDIPSQLQRHEKKFRISAIQEDGRMRDYEDAFFWLNDSRVVNICYNSTEPNVGLRMNLDRTTLKCYMADTGILISHAFDENEMLSLQLYRKLMLGKLEVNQGMLTENLVAQMLRASGHKLFFFSNSDRQNAANRMEIDFLIRKRDVTTRHNIVPVEVKSTSRYTHTSLDKFCIKYSEYVSTPYVLHSGDVMNKEGVIYLPLYMAMLL
ncbi:MAG: ATP-binding protein [Muribaculaceae bacterium]